MNTITKPKPLGTLDKLKSLSSPKDARIEQLDLDELIPDPNQPRSSFRPVDGKVDPQVLADLRHFADDLDARGQLQPILYRIVNGQKMIIAGERRWRGKKVNRDLGRKNSEKIDAIKRQDITAEELRLIQLSENLQREDLTDLETASYMQNLLEEFPDLKKKELGNVFNKNSQYVSRILAMLDPQWKDVIQSGAIQYASLLEQYRPLPDKQKAELRVLAQSEKRALTSGDIRAAKARAEIEAANKAGESLQSENSGGAANDAGADVVGGANGVSAGLERGSSSSATGQVALDPNLASEVSKFLASSSPEGETYRPSADATAGAVRHNPRIKDTGGDAVIPSGTSALSTAIHEKREIKMTVAQLEKLLSFGALEFKNHQLSLMLPVDEVKGALTKVGAPLPEDDTNVVMSLLEALNKM